LVGKLQRQPGTRKDLQVTCAVEMPSKQFPTSFPPSHTLSVQAVVSGVPPRYLNTSITEHAETQQQRKKCNQRSRTTVSARAMMSLQAKIAQKHASAQGPDPRAPVKTVGIGQADWSVFSSFRAIRLRRRGEREDRRFLWCRLAWRLWLGLSCLLLGLLHM
jgi:hypothetical protein